MSAAPPSLPTPEPAPPSQPILPAPAPAVTPPGAGPEAPAVSGVILSPPEVVLQVAQTGAVAIVVVGARDVMGVDLTVTWDAALAEVTEAAPGSLLSLEGVPVAAERALESGRARVRFTRATAVTGSGAVAALTLRGLKPGSGVLVVESLALIQPSGSTPMAPPAPGRLAVAP